MTSQSEYAHAAERFRKETADHEMTVLKDDGLYRHLRFKAPGHSFYWFDIVTWPGTLVVRGDVDGYMFTRVDDMFTFFRSRNGEPTINPHYWSEKVEGGRDITKSYSEDLFREHVLDYFKDAVRDGDVPRGLGKAIRAEILDDPDICYEDMARKLLDEFEHGAHYLVTCGCGASTETDGLAGAKAWQSSHHSDVVGEEARRSSEPFVVRDLVAAHKVSEKRVEGFRFSDTWEWDLRGYDWSFLWACHAIVWGIARYDEAARTAEAVAS